MIKMSGFLLAPRLYRVVVRRIDRREFIVHGFSADLARAVFIVCRAGTGRSAASRRAAGILIKALMGVVDFSRHPTMRFVPIGGARMDEFDGANAQHCSVFGGFGH